MTNSSASANRYPNAAVCRFREALGARGAQLQHAFAVAYARHSLMDPPSAAPADEPVDAFGEPVDAFTLGANQERLIRCGFVQANRDTSDVGLIKGATLLHQDLFNGARVSDAIVRAHRVARGEQTRTRKVLEALGWRMALVRAA